MLFPPRSKPINPLEGCDIRTLSAFPLPLLVPLAHTSSPFFVSRFLSPYTGTALTCYLSQYNNVLYILGASSSSPSDIYAYSFASSSWSTQSTSSAPDFTSATTGSVLDHDTNTFFTISGGTAMTQLDLSTLTSTGASSSSIAWEGVDTAPFTSTVSSSDLLEVDRL